MSGAPFFSVVIPVFNRSRLLIPAVSSVLRQTFQDFEIVIVNDGSSDDTLEVLNNTFALEKRIKIISQSNRERGAARNVGFAASAGRYVVFFDSDDLMHPTHLETLHRKIEASGTPRFIATKFDFVDENGNRRASDIQKLPEGYYDYKLFLNGNPLACNICVLKSNPELAAFEEDRNFAIKEDWMYLIQNTRNHPFYLIDQVTLSMTDHPGRSMRSDNRLIIKRTRAAMDWILNKVILSEAEKKQLAAHVNYFCGIHAYLDSDNKGGIRYALNAIRAGGLKIKYFTLLLKSIAGRKLISFVR
jgi:GalNAc5-diNAcBac-PP-undecaprenol beta-1,3-glucosyltransferase